jgi:hypothetical protein
MRPPSAEGLGTLASTEQDQEAKLKTITLSGNYGTSQYRYSQGDADVIDATNARWSLSNMGPGASPYPIIVEDGRTGLDIIGGTIKGKVSLTLDWVDVYAGDGTPDNRLGNSAAIELRDTLDATLRDWSISQVWDGIRIKEGSKGFVIEGAHVRLARDDAVENDYGVSGTIRDCLFDGVFSGIRLGREGRSDRSGNVVTIDNVLMRMESYLYESEVTHQAPLKMEVGSPSLRITNSVFAIEDVDHGGLWRMELAWERLLESSGNVFLNLSDTRLPKDYPMPGKGWTVLQGRAARDYWEAASEGWLASHGGEDPRVGSEGDDTLVGSNADDELNGLNGDDRLFGRAGNDILDGGEGGDRLEGGTGNDIYVLSASGDRIVEAAGCGVDTARAGCAATLGQHLENLVLTGTAAVRGMGNSLANRLTGNDAANLLVGLGGSDRILGGGGKDRLAGGAGEDDLSGGPGNDVFLFLRASDGGDLIADFHNAAGDDDRFRISASGFGGGLIAGGPLAASQFQVRDDNAAQDADDRFIFRRTDATLWFDSNGTSSGGLTLIADLQAGATVTHDDILLV